MKRQLFLLMLPFLFAACSSYDSRISSRFAAQECSFLTQAQIQSLDPDMYAIGQPNTDGNVEACDSMYTVNPSFSEKVHLAAERGDMKWCILLGILCIGFIAYGAYRSYNQRGGMDVLFLAFFGASILSGMGAVAVIDWAHTKQADITKKAYVGYMQKDGDLHTFWDENLDK